MSDIQFKERDRCSLSCNTHSHVIFIPLQDHYRHILKLQRNNSNLKLCPKEKNPFFLETCGPNEVYSDCINPCNDCQTRNIPCNFLVCNKGCDCRPSYTRNEEQICIPENQCPPGNNTHKQGPIYTYGDSGQKYILGTPHFKPRVVVGWLIDWNIVVSQLVEYGLMASC